ncbi:MAG: DUF4065 domain-containing protein [Clostridiales bacterium]|jgi:uncharacterized phage-associated protein|nr:DUF4065 domain-containing protein [Clostridiales bacterium]
MPTIVDAAKYMLHKKGSCTTMKLQKLCYYSNAWALARMKRPLFGEDFRAWASGPVCVEFFKMHKDVYVLKDGDLGEHDPDAFSSAEKTILDDVLEDYGLLAPCQITKLALSEDPWIKARGDTEPGLKCNAIIKKKAMAKFYKAQLADDFVEKRDVMKEAKKEAKKAKTNKKDDKRKKLMKSKGKKGKKGKISLGAKATNKTPTLTTIFDVAKHIIHKKGSVTPMLLNKLCYLSNASALASREVPLFDNDFLARNNGPVCLELLQSFEKAREIVLYEGDIGEYDENALTDDQKKCVDLIIEDYGNCFPPDLTAILCGERPWLEARAKCISGDCMNAKISKLDMYEYHAGTLD